MLNDLPEIELGEIFSPKHHDNNENNDPGQKIIDKDIYIYISIEPEKWIAVTFLDVSPGDIGIHVSLPYEIPIGGSNLDNVKMKFEKTEMGQNYLLKEISVLIRWQERDPISGKMKIGIHFHGETKNDPDLIDILCKLKKQKNAEAEC